VALQTEIRFPGLIGLAALRHHLSLAHKITKVVFGLPLTICHTLSRIDLPPGQFERRFAAFFLLNRVADGKAVRESRKSCCAVIF